MKSRGAVMEGKTRYYLDTRVLAILGAVAALPLVVGFFLIQGSARANLSRSVGENLARFAEFAAADKQLLTISLPIRDPATGDTIGVLRGFLCTDCLVQPITSLRFGETGHALLVQDDDGRVLAGTVAECIVRDNYHALEDYRAAVRQGQRYFIAGMSPQADSRQAELAGFAKTQLSSSYPTLNWVVLVEQSLTEAQAPIATQSRDIILFFLGIGLAVVVLALYLSFRLEKPVTDVEMDLHHDLGVAPGESGR
jgi:hypothetical protein